MLYSIQTNEISNKDLLQIILTIFADYADILEMIKENLSNMDSTEIEKFHNSIIELNSILIEGISEDFENDFIELFRKDKTKFDEMVKQQIRVIQNKNNEENEKEDENTISGNLLNSF